MFKSSLFNQSHFFKMKKIKDSGVLNISFSIMNHFMYACMGRERQGDGMYQNVRMRIHREGDQKFRLFAHVVLPNQKRVLKKLAKFMKSSYLN